MTAPVAVTLAGVGFAILAAVGLAVQSLAVRVGTRTHAVTSVIAVVFAVNLVVLVPVAAVVAYPQYGLTPVAVLSFATAGVLGSLLARLCYFAGIARIGASRTEPLKALFPVVAVALAVVALDERVTVRLLGGVALVLGGSAAVVAEASTSHLAARRDRLWLDLAFPLAAALLLGVDPIFTKYGLAEGTPAVVGVTVRIAAGAAGFAAYLAWRRLREGDGVPVSLDRWLAVASVANTVYLLSYYAALARAPVAVVTPVVGTSTLLVVAGAAVFLRDDERVTSKLAAAALVVALGVLLVVGG